MHGACLTRDGIREIGERLAGMTPQERLRLEGLQPSRADIVVHGICILLAVMKHLGISRILVSEYGNLDGFIRQALISRSVRRNRDRGPPSGSGIGPPQIKIAGADQGARLFLQGRFEGPGKIRFSVLFPGR